MNIELIIKIFFINIFTYFVCLKIINEKKKDYIKIIILSIVTTSIYVALRNIANNLFSTIIQYFIQLIFLRILVTERRKSILTANLISNSIVYVGFFIALVTEIIIKVFFHINSNLINMMFIFVIELIMLINLFKIKRLKNGFTFLTNKTNSEYLDIIMINISIVIIFIYCLFGNYYGDITKQLSICMLVLAIIMFIMIQKTLNLYYKQKLLIKTIQDNENTIKEKDEQIKKLSDEKFKISKLNHEFYNRQKALEEKVNNFVNSTSAEISSESSVIESINKLSNEYTAKLENIKNPDKLQTTDIEEIDDMFKYMQSECLKNNINFNLQINGNIHHMVNNIIPKDKLATLIGDHIRDAIIAVSYSTNKFKSILAILGKKDNRYEFCVYDTGIEFEINTLLKLGIEPATTHEDTGGTGIGFITTFETMKETKASLIINENKPVDNNYTKSVTIKFDDKNEYRICSYRADKIKDKDTENRIIIESKKEN